jgi:very-short-patch-repair endonuclease
MRFRRQHPIGPFIADFACIPARLIVEVDGATHGSDAERRSDARREAFLRSRSWRIARVTNHEIYHSLMAVLDLIYQRAVEAPSTASRSSSPAKGGGGK